MTMKYLASISEALDIDLNEAAIQEETFTITIESKDGDIQILEYADVNTFFDKDVCNLKEGDVVTFPEVESVIQVIKNLDSVKESIENGDFDIERTIEESVSESIIATVEYVATNNVTNESETFKNLFIAVCSMNEGDDKKYFVIHEQ